jgi:hypothetical protein
MCETAFAFTYQDSTGVEDAIDLESMRKLWVDRNRSGIVFAETVDDGSTEFLHEIVMEGQDMAEGMVEIMETLLGVQSFELLEQPLPDDHRARIVLEFRHPHPHTVALALRA